MELPSSGSIKKEVPHDHCLNCFSRSCVHPFTSVCNVLFCPHGCGALLHSCKLEDHFIVCPTFLQPCINSIYGCPYTLRKNCIAKHLSLCPASTVVCTMDWNRNPLNLKNTIKMSGYNPNASVFNNLEVATALRDQRVLLEAVVPAEVLKGVIENISDHPLLCLSRKLNSSGSMQVMQHNTNGVVVHQKSSEDDFISKKLSMINCDLGADLQEVSSCFIDQKSKEHQAENEVFSMINCDINAVFQEVPSYVNDQKNKEHRSEKKLRKPLLRTQFGRSPKKVFKDSCCDTSDLEVDDSTMKWMSPSVNVCSFDSTTLLFEIIGAYEKYESISYSHSSEGIRCTLSDTRLCSYRHEGTQSRPFYDVRGKVGNSVHESLDSIRNDCIVASRHNPKLYETLALNQVVECLPRYERKRRAMYSFMCNNLFRRDQFNSHFQNVHSDICSNLNGWLEEKCPYAQYGCNYSQFRFTPNSFRSMLVYDNSRSCLAVKRLDCNCKQASADGPSLLSLPWEVLAIILNYLDSYSIGQLSQTCVYLKSLCISFFKERGIVSVNWEKFKRIDGNITWQMVGKTWYFSNSFTKIDKWVFNDIPSMSEHIRTCPIASAHNVTYPKDLRVKLCPKPDTLLKEQAFQDKQ